MIQTWLGCMNEDEHENRSLINTFTNHPNKILHVDIYLFTHHQVVIGKQEENCGGKISK